MHQPIIPGPVLRRVSSVLFALLLLPQLQLGSWTWCTFDRDMESAQGPADPGMMAMTQPRAPGRGVPIASFILPQAGLASEGCTAAAECDSPGMPQGAGSCASVTCSAIVTPLSAAVVDPGDAKMPLTVPEPVSLQSAPAHAPEPPPPRA